MADIFEFIRGEGRIGPPKNTGIPASGPGEPTLGYYLAAMAFPPPASEAISNQYIFFNYTGPPGSCSNLYYKLMFWLPKYQFTPVKVDEWINVSPTHSEYYQRTMTQKRELEGIVKTGLASAAGAIADFELVNHDLRKYKQIMNYFSDKDEHSLRAMFIDQVDVHTGNMAIVQIVQRWSTIIIDFQKLTDEDVEPDKIVKKLDVSKAEAIVLTTKNKLYLEWKNMFREAAKERYEHIRGLVQARKKSIEEYREWLKPYIAKYKMFKETHEQPGGRMSSLSSWYEATGQRTFVNGIKLWAWKPFVVGEARTLPTIKPSQAKKFVFDPYDDYVRENLVLNNKTGLAKLYPWLLNTRTKGGDKKYVYEADAIADELKKEWTRGERGLDANRIYWLLLDFDIKRIGLVLPGGELEDMDIYCRMILLSQNILLVKLMELKCRERELERYIEEILGLRTEDEKIEDVVKKEYPKLFGAEPKEKTEWEKMKDEWKKVGNEFNDFFRNLGGKLAIKPEHRLFFVKPGEYDRDWTERITKQYLVTTGNIFGGVTNFLTEAAGVS